MTKHSNTESQPNLEALTTEHGFVAHMFLSVRKVVLLYYVTSELLTQGHSTRPTTKIGSPCVAMEVNCMATERRVSP